MHITLQPLNKRLRYLLFSVSLLVGLLASCSDSDTPSPKPAPDPAPQEETSGFIVFNSGNQYGGVPGSLSSVFQSAGQWGSAYKLFESANQKSVGMTLQGGLIQDGLLYVLLFDSNLYRVLDAKTYKEIVSCSFPEEYGGPRSMVSDGEWNYVSMYGGYVLRAKCGEQVPEFEAVKVGPNPEGLAISGGMLFVANSDGMNYLDGYQNGKSVSVIDLKTFQVVNTVEVGLNPIVVCAGPLGSVLVLCMGDYYEHPATIWQIGKDLTAKDTAIEATIMDVSGDVLYAVNAPYGSEEIAYRSYDASTLSGLSGAFVSEGVDAPTAMKVDAESGRIILLSNHLVGGYASYSTDGYCKVYDKNGQLLYQAETGVGPYAAIPFNQ